MERSGGKVSSEVDCYWLDCYLLGYASFFSSIIVDCGTPKLLNADVYIFTLGNPWECFEARIFTNFVLNSTCFSDLLYHSNIEIVVMWSGENLTSAHTLTTIAESLEYAQRFIFLLLFLSSLMYVLISASIIFFFVLMNTFRLRCVPFGLGLFGVSCSHREGRYES